MRPFSVDLSITVSGGIGSATYLAFGIQRMTVIQVPAGTSPKYDYAIIAQGRGGVGGRTGCFGNYSPLESIPTVRGGTFYILNATDDGIYPVNLLFESTALGV